MTMPRDLRYAGWHTIGVGDIGSKFYFSDGPYVTGVSTSAINVTFSANVVCQAYIQWALNPADLGTASGWTNAPGEESFAYSTHAQTATGLNPATTYYIRAIITDALGTSLTSSTISYTTEGDSPPPPSTTPGYRYDLYGTGASGNFPTLGVLANESGQLYGGTAVAWTDSNVYIVPTAYLNDSAGLVSWIMNTVPDGESATNPTYIVFDSSHNGASSTQYGAGTYYTLATGLDLYQGGSSVRRNLVFWGYNSKIKVTGVDYRTFHFHGGGWENVHVLGFEMEGPGSGTMSWQANGYNGAGEGNIHVDITSFSGHKMLDCYTHHGSQGWSSREWGLGQSGNYQHYDGWSHGPYSNDAEVAYNEMADSMNQGLIVNSGWNVVIHHNYIHDTRQTLIDFEDWNYNYIGSLARRIVNCTIRDNKFGDWAWQSPDCSWNSCMSVISVGHRFYETYGSLGIDYYQNMVIKDNWFAGQQRGMGNPESEIALCGTSSTLNQQPLWNRSGFAIVTPPSWQRNGGCAPHVNLTITGNVSTFPQWMLDLDGVSRHWGHISDASGTLTITDNDFQGMDYMSTGVSVTFDRNGTSTLLAY